MLTHSLTDVWSDLYHPAMWWQIAIAALCMLASYIVSHFFSRRFPINTSSSATDIIAARFFASLRFSVVLLAFLYIGKFILAQWQHVYFLSLLLPLVGSLALIRFGIYLSRRIFVHTPEISSQHLLIEKIFSWGVCLGALFYYTGLLQDAWAFMDGYVISIGRNKLTLAEILHALIWVVVTVLLALWTSAALDRRLMKVNSLHMSLRMVLSRLGRSLLIICAVLISLNLVGIDLTVLSVFGGALGVGLGLGLQKIASNYVSGFIILLDRSLSINDMITVDKYSGKVSEINTRYTVLKGLDGVESIIPNEMLVSSPVQNLSLTDREVLMNTNLTVGYNTDIEALLPKLEKVAASIERVSKKLLPSANLINFGVNGLELTIGFWINDPENGRTGVLSQVNRAIWTLLQEQNVDIVCPQLEVRTPNRD